LEAAKEEKQEFFKKLKLLEEKQKTFKKRDSQDSMEVHFQMDFIISLILENVGRNSWRKCIITSRPKRIQGIFLFLPSNFSGIDFSAL
jgi:hypothetical protein